jgi:hypothetical protein
MPELGALRIMMAASCSGRSSISTDGEPSTPARYTNRDGFATLRGVFFGEEIAELERDAGRLFQRTDLIDSDNIRCRWQNHVETGECRFDCFDRVAYLSYNAFNDGGE